MTNLEPLKSLIRLLMTEHLGEPGESDLALIRAEATGLGLNNRQLSALMQEVYASINWTKLRDEQEGEDRVSGEPIYIFKLEVKSLQKLGEVLFKNPEPARRYLTDEVLLKANVNYLSHQNTDLAMSFSDLYQSENDPEKRYLKICYRLNPKLPYRVGQQEYLAIENLLEAGFNDRPLMNQVYQEYVSGRLHSWLHARNPTTFRESPEKKGLLPFLKFVYQVNPGYPFYLDKVLLATPLEMVAKALENLGLWEKIAEACANRTLFVWFEAQGHPEWNTGYQTAWQATQQDEKLEDPEKIYTAVQTLLRLIDTSLAAAVIAFSQDSIENLNLPASKTVAVTVWLTLKNAGFIKASLGLSTPVVGLALDQSQIVLFNLTDQRQAAVTLLIEPQRLIKNKRYDLSLQINLSDQRLEIPVRLQAVFPWRAVMLDMLKYGIIGALLLGACRWWLAAGTGSYDGLAPQLITTAISRSLPEYYLTFYEVFLVLLMTVILAVPVIRKAERL